MMLSAILAVAWGLVVGGLGALLTDLSPWYYALRKPSWQPPDWLFGPAWTIILALASYSAYLGWENAPDAGTRWLVVVLFLTNGLLNMGWSLLFFRLRRPDWAIIEVGALWLSILAPIVLLQPVSTTASLMLLPYIAWVSFASVLNLAIVRRNRPFNAIASVA